MKLVVPLVSQGELIGLLNLGPRLSDQDYSTDDRKLLDNLAAQAAPALRVGQLVREQEAEARARERIEQELEVARLIQQNFLPRELPDLPGWQVSAHYRPAREVGGDFYDFIELAGRPGWPRGRRRDRQGRPGCDGHGGDAERAPRRRPACRLSRRGARTRRTTCSAPTCRRRCSSRASSPCSSRRRGVLRYRERRPQPAVRAHRDGRRRAPGNRHAARPDAGHDVRREGGGARAGREPAALLATALAEAHDPSGEMFGFPRLRELMGRAASTATVDGLLAELDRFTGPGWEQEDDITLVRSARPAAGRRREDERHACWPRSSWRAFPATSGRRWKGSPPRWPGSTLPPNPRPAADRRLRSRDERDRARERGFGRAAGGGSGPGRPGRAARADLGSGRRPADRAGGAPDLEAKLEGLQKPRGWGLFLIEHMTDGMDIWTDGERHTVELTFRLRGEKDADESL